MLVRRLRSDSAALPAPFRRPAAVVVVLSAVMFVSLCLHYAGEDGYTRLDTAAVEVAKDHLSAYGRLFSFIARMGSPLPVLLGMIVLALVCLALRRFRLAVLAVAGPAIAGGLTIVLKPIVGRVRFDDFAFPSGHAVGLIALCLVAALLVLSFAGSHLALVGALALTGVIVAATAITVAVTTRGGHYWTDTVGSFCLAVVIVLGLALLLDRLPGRLRGGDGPWPGRPASAAR